MSIVSIEPTDITEIMVELSKGLRGKKCTQKIK